MPQGDKAAEKGGAPSGGAGHPKGLGGKLRHGEVAQAGRPGPGKIGQERKSQARRRQGLSGLQAVAEEKFAGVVSGDNLILAGEQGRGTGGRMAYGQPPALLELLEGQTAVGGQRVVLTADARHGTEGQFLIDGLLWAVFPEGEENLNIAHIQQIFNGIKGDEAGDGHQRRVLPAQLG